MYHCNYIYIHLFISGTSPVGQADGAAQLAVLALHPLLGRVTVWAGKGWWTGEGMEATKRGPQRRLHPTNETIRSSHYSGLGMCLVWLQAPSAARARSPDWPALPGWGVGCSCRSPSRHPPFARAERQPFIPARQCSSSHRKGLSGFPPHKLGWRNALAQQKPRLEHNRKRVELHWRKSQRDGCGT